jgi:hypothetical protein
MTEDNGNENPRGLEATLSDTEQQVRRAGRMCKKEGGGAACAFIDMAALMITGARGLAANASLQGTTGDGANTAASPGPKMGEVKSATPVGEVTEATGEDGDGDA